MGNAKMQKCKIENPKIKIRPYLKIGYGVDKIRGLFRNRGSILSNMK